MARKNTNKQYSLRKLKTGTASVAVALTVLGAGLAIQTEVKAENTEQYDQYLKKAEEDRNLKLKNDLQNLKASVNNLQQMMSELDSQKSLSRQLNWDNIGVYARYLRELNDQFQTYLEQVTGDDSRRLFAKEIEENRELKKQISELTTKASDLAKELDNTKQDKELAKETLLYEINEKKKFVDSIAKVLEDKEVQRHNLQQSLDTAKAELDKKEQELQLVKGNLGQKEKELDQKEKELENEELAKESAISDLTEQINAKKAEVEKLAQDLADKSAEIQEKEAEKDRQQHMYEAFMSQYKEKVEKQEQELAKLKQLETINNNLLGNAKDMIAKLSAKNEQLASEKAKLEEQNKISDASRQGLRRDLNASREAKKQLEAEHQKLEEQNKISEASRKGLRRDLDASREAKKQVEKDLANLTAELDKVKEDKQISDASRKGLRRDLDASREAKKQVEKALEEANSKLAALEKLNKELEESKKLTEKEKAELQAKLEAEAKALKEKLAKQAEELAKLRAGKASDSQTPDAKPGNKVVPGKGQAPQAGTKPNQNKEPMKETKRQLPSTGEATNPFFTAAALAVMATAGVAAVAKRKEEN